MYIDQSDPARAPWRFNFTEVSVTPETFTCPSTDLDIVYRDPTRNAELRCQARFANTPPGMPAPKYPGCELYVNGEVLFSSNFNDLGMDRFVGSLGPLPLNNTGILRTPNRVLGMRVK